MKRIMKIALLTVVVSCGTGCTTGYWLDRGRDAADIFTLTVGLGAGAKARIGPVQTGLMVNFYSAGLRGGEFSTASRGRDEFPNSVEGELIAYGVDWFFTPYNERYKSYESALKPSTINYVPFVRIPEPPGACPAYYTQIEVVAGLGGTLRLGFNPGELLDFILGFVGVDIYHDDIDKRKKREIEQGSPPPSGAD